jgi:hypothetical protein
MQLTMISTGHSETAERFLEPPGRRLLKTTSGLMQLIRSVSSGEAYEPA